MHRRRASSGTPGLAQPRRKTSYSRRREDSWELVDSSNQPSPSHGNNESRMEIDRPSNAGKQLADQIIHPLRAMAERVGREVEQFAEELDRFKSTKDDNLDNRRRNALGLVRRYEGIARETVEKLRKKHGAEQKTQFKKNWQARLGSSKNDLGLEAVSEEAEETAAGTTLADLDRWHTEWQTWSLLHRLIASNYRIETGESKETVVKRQGLIGINDRFRTDGAAWRDFIVNDDMAKERLTVLKWLEETCEITGDDFNIIETQVQEASGKSKGLFGQGWLDTRERIKNEKRLRLWNVPIDKGIPDIQSSNGDCLLVTQLDLDAVTRQGRYLEEADATFEQSFWLLAWQMIRRGRPMDEILDWCLEYNEQARAYAIGALPSDHASKTHSALVAHINSRFRWRQACLFGAKEGAAEPFERAVLGLLGGDIDSVVPICGSWDDHLHANYNSLLLAQYNEHIRMKYKDSLPPKEIYSFGGVPEARSSDQAYVVSARQVIAELQNQPQIELQAHEPLKKVQASFICHDFEDFVFQQGVAFAREMRATRPNTLMEVIATEAASMIPESDRVDLIANDLASLRVITHAYLLFGKMGWRKTAVPFHVATDNVVCAYIDFLRCAGKISLIPYYAARLSPGRAEHTMAKVLPDITGPTEKREIIKHMELAGIHVGNVVLEVYNYIIKKCGFEPGKEGHINDIDLLEPNKQLWWPGRRLKQFGNEELTSEEQYLVHTAEWFLDLEGYWVKSFAVVTSIAIIFLRSHRLKALSALFDRVTFEELSNRKTVSVLGKRCHIMLREAFDGETSDSTSRSMAKASKPGTDVSKNETQIMMLREHARCYYEIEQLVGALDCLREWRELEDKALAEHKIATTNQNMASTGSLKKGAREIMAELKGAMNMLLQNDFMTTTGPVATAETLSEIRDAYLPGMIMSYTSALSFLGHMAGREHFVTTLNLATSIAENEELMESFKKRGHMAELVDAFARCNQAMLNNSGDKGQKNGKLWGPHKAGFGIWDIAA